MMTLCLSTWKDTDFYMQTTINSTAVIFRIYITTQYNYVEWEKNGTSDLDLKLPVSCFAVSKQVGNLVEQKLAGHKLDIRNTTRKTFVGSVHHTLWKNLHRTFTRKSLAWNNRPADQF